MTETAPAPGSSPLSINIDVSIVQSPMNPERGISAYARDFALALDAAFDEEYFDPLWVIDDDLPMPSALEPIADAGRLVPFSQLGAHRPPRLTHLLSPLYGPVGPLRMRRWLDANPAPYLMTLYDIVPYLMQDAYLTTSTRRVQYLAQLEWLRQADGLLAISEHSRRDALEHLGVPDERAIGVGTGISERFSPALDRDASVRAAVAAVPGLRPGFIMYTGGPDERKNVPGLIRAYALLDPELRTRHQLAIVYRIHDNQRKDLAALAVSLGIADDLLLTGFVADDPLLEMYRSTELFVFPSLSEGFGLPVAEALSSGAVTIAADNSSLPEVLPITEARFDADRPEEIAAAMHRGLTDARLRGRLLAAAAGIDRSWSPVIERTTAAYHSFAARRGV